METTSHYSKLTVRFLFYILVSKFPSLYPNDHRTYKSVVARSTKIRRADPELNLKFIDPTRHFIQQKRSYHAVELWMEKESLRVMVEPLARIFAVNVLITRGFTSYSAISRALERAKRRGIKLILYIGDHDPSGLMIEQVAQREMNIQVKRVMVTDEQAKRLKLIPIPVNPRDSRSKDYVETRGNQAWETESIRPRTFRRILRIALEAAVPREFRDDLRLKRTASALARPTISTIVRRIEGDVRRWLREGVGRKEVMRRLRERYR